MNENVAVFHELQELEPVDSWGVVSAVDYFSTLELSRKLTELQDPQVASMLTENRRTRQAMYVSMQVLECVSSSCMVL